MKIEVTAFPRTLQGTVRPPLRGSGRVRASYWGATGCAVELSQEPCVPEARSFSPSTSTDRRRQPRARRLATFRCTRGGRSYCTWILRCGPSKKIHISAAAHRNAEISEGVKTEGAS